MLPPEILSFDISCTKCGQDIPAGEPCRKWKGKYAGYLHMPCFFARVSGTSKGAKARNAYKKRMAQ